MEGSAYPIFWPEFPHAELGRVTVNPAHVRVVYAKTPTITRLHCSDGWITEVTLPYDEVVFQLHDGLQSYAALPWKEQG